MPTAAAEQIRSPDKKGLSRLGLRLVRRPLIREILIVLAFCLFTALLTWPYVTRLRDAVADPGDPYLVAWILWWDYHATFTDPLNLFHANVFFPYRYTLAFSEHCYGLALLFFPLFALGARPLTVHAVAIFFGFALCGYGAFRLARTLTNSYGVAWVAGIVFAFVPYRFHLLSHLPYLFSPWIPLLIEALVLFVYARTRKRALWLGVAFVMTGLTTVSWFTLSLVPFVLCGAVLLTRHQLWRERQFWMRGATALGLGSVALLPFMLPYLFVSRMYGFQRRVWEIQTNSAWPIHWLSAEERNKLWHGMGAGIVDGYKFRLFPGLLPLLLSLAALLPGKPFAGRSVTPGEDSSAKKWLRRLDAIILIALVAATFAIGFGDTDFYHGIFRYLTSARVLAVLVVVVIARLCLAYPSLLRRGECANLLETIRSSRRGDAFWVGVVLTIVGFCYSLGWNFFFYRVVYDLLPVFRSMRVPTRGAMVAYLGLALLAGLGAQRLAGLVGERQLRIGAVYVGICALLLVEFNAAPLKFIRGDVFPDAVTLRLKETPMRGGLVVLPANASVNHRHILRAADHGKPLVVGTSGFNPPYESEIEELTRTGTIDIKFLELLEKIPTSYVVVQTQLIAPERGADYETFLAFAVVSGRLRFIRSFGDRDDLYAVVKTEPEAKQEASLPFKLELKAWDERLDEDPVYLLGQYQPWSEAVYRFYITSYGVTPRFKEFLPDVQSVGRDVFAGLPNQDSQLQRNLETLALRWVERPRFEAIYQNMTDAEYIDRLLANAHAPLNDEGRKTMVQKLTLGELTRAGALVEIVNDPQFAEREKIRAAVLLHYFGYLRRNPDDLPDKDLSGMIFWIEGLQRDNDLDKLSRAFHSSGEYQQFKRQRGGEQNEAK
ncbi:MAG: hypothetical protein ND895_10210 [Pyrinomonadaceae bacterium]|nr:hypothetical protein [Pyrinomonadaceae bacterium]